MEVTLLTEAQQHAIESFPVHRHLKTFVKKGIKFYLILISPSTFLKKYKALNNMRIIGIKKSG